MWNTNGRPKWEQIGPTSAWRPVIGNAAMQGDTKKVAAFNAPRPRTAENSNPLRHQVENPMKSRALRGSDAKP